MSGNVSVDRLLVIFGSSRGDRRLDCVGLRPLVGLPLDDGVGLLLLRDLDAALVQAELRQRDAGDDEDDGEQREADLRQARDHLGGSMLRACSFAGSSGVALMSNDRLPLSRSIAELAP